MPRTGTLVEEVTLLVILGRHTPPGSLVGIPSGLEKQKGANTINKLQAVHECVEKVLRTRGCGGSGQRGAQLIKKETSYLTDTAPVSTVSDRLPLQSCKQQRCGTTFLNNRFRP